MRAPALVAARGGCIALTGSLLRLSASRLSRIGQNPRESDIEGGIVDQTAGRHRDGRRRRTRARPGPGHDAADLGGATLTVGILLWPAFPLMSLAGIVESLRHAADHGDASQQRYARWDILGLPPARTASSCGLAVEATAPYPHPASLDCLFVIGGLLRDLAAAPGAHRRFIGAAHRAGTTVVGVCTGSFVLAEEGLLEGRRACIHPYHAAEFRAAFPKLRLVPDRDYEIVDRVGTALGGVSILPLMTALIGRHCGPDRAAKIVHQMTRPGGPDAGAAMPDPARTGIEIADPRIQKALVTLDAQAARPPSIAALARSLGLSERHFARLFRAQVGRSPQDYLVRTRLRIAVWMLRNTERSVTAIAYAAGFSSGANLADQCRRRLHATPSEIRRRARAAAAAQAGAGTQERPEGATGDTPDHRGVL